MTILITNKLVKMVNFNKDPNSTNLYAALPIVGQAIGIYTVAVNTFHVLGAACAYVGASLAKKNSQVLRVEAKERFIYHISYIGIGIVRFALPILGGLTLWSTKAVPQRKYEFIKNQDDIRIKQIYDRYQNHLTSREKVAYFILAIPGGGVVLGAVCLGKMGLEVAGIAGLIVLKLFFVDLVGYTSEDRDLRNWRINLTSMLFEDFNRLGQCLVGTALPVIGGLTFLGANAQVQEIAREGEKPPKQQKAEKIAPSIPRPEKGFHIQMLKEERVNTLVPEKTQLPAAECSATGVDARRIALVLGDTQIGNSSYEGGMAKDSVSYWKQVIEGDKNLQTFVEEEKKKEILADFEDLAATESLLRGGKGEEFINYVYDRLEQRKRVVLTLSVKGTAGSPGHVFGVVIEKKSSSLAYYFLNKGDGAEIFPTASIEGKPCPSYRSLGHTLDRRLFSHENRELDLALAEKLIGFTNLEPKNGEWTSTDLEGMFFAVSKPNQKGKIQAATPQRSGTCSEQLARLVMLDHLDDKTQYKRVILSGKIEASKHLEKMANVLPAKLVARLRQAAAHSFTKAFENKMINQDELDFTHQLLKRIEVKTPPLGQDLPNMGEPLDRLKVTSWASKETKDTHYNPINSIKTPDYSKLELKEKIALLDRLSADEIFGQYQKETEEEKTKGIFALMRTLPITEGWNLTDEEKEKCINVLTKANMKLPSNDPETVLFNLHALAICDHLCSTLPKGFHIVPLLDGIQHKLDLRYGDTAVRFEKIADYFRSVNAKNDLFGFLNLSSNDFIQDFDACIEARFAAVQNPCVKDLYDYLYQFKDKITKYNTKTGKDKQEMLYRLLSTEYGFTDWKAYVNCNEEDHLPKSFRNLAKLMSRHYQIMLPKQKDDSVNHFDINAIRTQHRTWEEKGVLGTYINESIELSGLRKVAAPLKQKIKPLGNYFKNDTVQEKKENEIYHGTAESLANSFAQFDAYPEMRIPYLINWVNQHPLEAIQVFDEVKTGFFRDHALLKALRAEPAIQKNIEEMVLRQLNSLSPRSHMEAIKWIKLALYCETQAHQAGHAFNQSFVDSLKERLDLKINNGSDNLGELFECRAALELYPSPWKKEQFINYLIYNTCAKFYETNISDNEYVIREIAQQAHFQAYLSENKELIGNSILQKLNMATSQSWSTVSLPRLIFQRIYY